MYFIEIIACLHQFLTIFMKFIEVIILDYRRPRPNIQTGSPTRLRLSTSSIFGLFQFPVATQSFSDLSFLLDRESDDLFLVFDLTSQSFSDPFSWTENFTQ